MWFVVCCWPQSQEGDLVRPHLCKLARHGPWPVWKWFIRDCVWRGRWKPGCRIVGPVTIAWLSTEADDQSSLHCVIVWTDVVSDHIGRRDASRGCPQHCLWVWHHCYLLVCHVLQYQAGRACCCNRQLTKELRIATAYHWHLGTHPEIHSFPTGVGQIGVPAYWSPLRLSDYLPDRSATATYRVLCLQCFDAVGWVIGKEGSSSRKGIHAVKNLSGGVLAWLFVWSKVQTCV